MTTLEIRLSLTGIWFAGCTAWLREVERTMRGLRIAVPVLATIPLAGCELAGDIFKAGMWVGVIAVVVVIALVGAIATRIRG